MRKSVINILISIVCGSITGIMALYLGAISYTSQKFTWRELFNSYFENGLLIFLNLLIPVILSLLFFFLSRRPSLANLISGFIVLLLASINHVKISLRDNPLVVADINYLTTAAGVADKYEFDISDGIIFCFVTCILISAILFLLEKFRLIGPEHCNDEDIIRKYGLIRLEGLILTAVLAFVSINYLYFDSKIDASLSTSLNFNKWHDTELYLSKGFMYSLVRSGLNMDKFTPNDYNKNKAQELLSHYTDSNIDNEKKINVIGIMLEAFGDFSDFESLQGFDEIEKMYEPFHAFEDESISGDLVVNVFGGETINSEWAALTGYSSFNTFRSNVNSYVRYFNSQGYTTHFYHPNYSWMYHRNVVCDYLGFSESFFSENYFADEVTPEQALYKSDAIVFNTLLADLKEAKDPVFDFAVTYQNHGPYGTASSSNRFITTASGFTAETCNILNNYFERQNSTINALIALKDELKKQDKPVVLFLFGDHKPWGGNSNSAYKELGADDDVRTLKGIKDYYTTPYIIWANPAAKEVLESDFCSDEGYLSPCFLLSKVFDACGFEGPSFMKLSRDVRAITTVLKGNEIFFVDDIPCTTLPDDDYKFVRNYVWSQYYHQTHFND